MTVSALDVRSSEAASEVHKDSKKMDIAVKTPIQIDEDEPSSQFLSSSEFMTAPSEVFNSGNAEEMQRSGSMKLSHRSSQSSWGQSLTLDRLRFSQLRMHGRIKEQEILMQSLRNISDQKEEQNGDRLLCVKQLVLVSGESGTGKTALTFSLSEAVQQRGGVFAIGKYSLQHKAEPYLALETAFERIFECISNPSSTLTEKLDAFRGELLEQLGDGIGLLAQIIPSVVKYIFKKGTLAGYESDSSEEFGHNGRLHEAKAKLHFIVRVLFRVVCKHYAPVVIALDDLQWADVASLEMIKDLILDSENRDLMFIVLYRSDELQEESTLAKTISGLREKAGEDIFSMTEVEIGSIEIEDVNGMITDLLSIDSSPATMALARLCHRRTGGNVFFVLAFLRMLKENNYLLYNLGFMRWTWDLTRIETETTATTNVVSLTKRKMDALTREYQTVLILAACLGHMFERRKLEIVAQDFIARADSKKEFIDGFFASAVQDGFLEGPLGSGNMQYRWIHDSIQEAAVFLMPENELVKFKYDVGKNLLKDLDGREVENLVFVIVGLLNPYATEFGGLKDSEKVILAALNLRAAKRARKLSAYVTVSKFAKVGVSLLPQGHWDTLPELSYKLFTIATEAEGTQMKEGSMKNLGAEVLKQKNVSLFDKMRIYRAYLSYLGLGKQGKAGEAVTLCLDVLSQLGCHFPRTELTRTLALISSLLKHKKALRERTAEEVAALPVLADRRLREIDSMLTELSLYTYIAGKTTLCGLCTVKRTSITLKHGIHGNSHDAFSALSSFFVVAFGDLKGAEQIAQYCRMLKERAHGTRGVAGYCMMQGSFLLPWSSPWSLALKVLLEGYECGVRDGQLRDAIYCVSSYCWGALFSGTRLDKLRDDINIYVRHTSELNAGSPLESILIVQRLCDLLIDGNNGKDQGHVLVREFEGTFKDDDYMMAMLNVYQGAVYYGRSEFEKGSELAQEVGTLLDKLLSHPAGMPSLYQQCLALYASARRGAKRSKRRKLKRLGIKRHNKLKMWARGGCINAVHYVAILDAELAALNQAKKRKIEELYQKAIVLAARGAFVQDAAVASERLGEYLYQLGDLTEAGRRYEQASQYFEEWGFPRKATLFGKEKQDAIATWSISRGNAR